MFESNSAILVLTAHFLFEERSFGGWVAHGIADTFAFGVTGKLGGLPTRGGGRRGPDRLYQLSIFILFVDFHEVCPRPGLIDMKIQS